MWQCQSSNLPITKNFLHRIFGVEKCTEDLRRRNSDIVVLAAVGMVFFWKEVAGRRHGILFLSPK